MKDKADSPCLACQLPAEQKKLHWFYSFSSPEKLFAHLADEGISTTEEYRARLADWYRECQSLVASREVDPARYREATEHIRRWTLLVREAKTPEEIDRLAAELLSPDAQGAVRFWTDMWRKHPSGVKVSRDMADDIASHLTSNKEMR
jgi:hypothetical protein